MLRHELREERLAPLGKRVAALRLRRQNGSAFARVLQIAHDTLTRPLIPVAAVTLAQTRMILA